VIFIKYRYMHILGESQLSLFRWGFRSTIKQLYTLNVILNLKAKSKFILFMFN